MGAVVGAKVESSSASEGESVVVSTDEPTVGCSVVVSICPTVGCVVAAAVSSSSVGCEVVSLSSAVGCSVVVSLVAVSVVGGKVTGSCATSPSMDGCIVGSSATTS